MLEFVQKNLDLLSGALDAMPEKVLVLDRRGHIVLVNAAWRRLCRTYHHDAKTSGPGATLRSLGILDADDDDTADFLVGLDRVVTGRADALTSVCRSAGGVAGRWYRMHASRVHLGRWTGVVVTLDDVSDAHLARQAIHRLSLRLNNMQEQERERIALELHDSTAQHLAAASLTLVGLKTRLDLTGRNALLFDDIERSLQSALHEIRVMSFALYTPRLDEGGLRTTLERFARTYTRQTGIRTSLRSPDLDMIPVKLQQTLLRVVQEALTNIHRHADASRAGIRFRITRQSIVLSITDNGRGMDQKTRSRVATAGTGIGISGMHARVDQFGGELKLKSQKGRGTRVLARIPLPEEPSAPELRSLLPSWLHAGAGRRKRRAASVVTAKAS